MKTGSKNRRDHAALHNWSVWEKRLPHLSQCKWRVQGRGCRKDIGASTVFFRKSTSDDSVTNRLWDKRRNLTHPSSLVYWISDQVPRGSLLLQCTIPLESQRPVGGNAIWLWPFSNLACFRITYSAIWLQNAEADLSVTCFLGCRSSRSDIGFHDKECDWIRAKKL